MPDMDFKDLQPVRRSELESGTAAFVPPTPSPVASAPARLPAVPTVRAQRSVSGKALTGPVDLDWPVTYGERVYDRIIRQRPTAQQVADYVARWMAAPEGVAVRFPVFVDEAGELIPDAVMDLLDDDDSAAVMDGIDDFLSARLRRLRGAQP